MTNFKCHNNEFWTHYENSSFWPSIWEFVVLAFWVWQSSTFEKNYSSLWQVTVGDCGSGVRQHLTLSDWQCNLAERWTNSYNPMLLDTKPKLIAFVLPLIVYVKFSIGKILRIVTKEIRSYIWLKYSAYPRYSFFNL